MISTASISVAFILLIAWALLIFGGAVAAGPASPPASGRPVTVDEPNQAAQVSMNLLACGGDCVPWRGGFTPGALVLTEYDCIRYTPLECSKVYIPLALRNHWSADSMVSEGADLRCSSREL